MTPKNIFDTIHERKSIRSFTDQEISDDSLLKIAKIGRASPTAKNEQKRIFTIVKNSDLINQLAQAIATEIGQEGYDFYNPAALILVSVPDASPYSLLEVGAASQNILLAATALNLGSIWPSQLKGITNQPDIRNVLTKLSIPTNHLCFNVIALGHPAEKPTEKERTEKIQLF